MPKWIWRNLTVCAISLLLLPSAVLVPSARAAAHQDAAKEPAKIDSEVFAGLSARSIGPSVTGGRIAALDGVVDKGRITLFVGSAGGGVWRSTNSGTTFKPIFEKYSQSIGAMAIDRSNPKVVWVGTGEAWTRNSVSVGTGLYKSTDSGDNWDKVGLADSEHIARIVIDPKDSNTVYVAALGHLWNSNSERGLYKTTDGGKTW
ncbi:MAG TPA: glycosyl hydrolase, partial [Blastocatellia bacterium]|nr:glycosyl hydrolase [Blastocatellia bacterium]